MLLLLLLVDARLWYWGLIMNVTCWPVQRSDDFVVEQSRVMTRGERERTMHETETPPIEMPTRTSFYVLTLRYCVLELISMMMKLSNQMFLPEVCGIVDVMWREIEDVDVVEIL